MPTCNADLLSIITEQDICVDCLERHAIIKVAVSHRTGVVEIGESSVIIAVSSAHRLEAINACHWMIDTLKAAVPIWKKEFFADGHVWKENAESQLLGNPSNT